MKGYRERVKGKGYTEKRLQRKGEVKGQSKGLHRERVTEKG